MATVLERMGMTVTYPPDQTCCGQPAYNAGHHPPARRMARHFIRAFAGDAPIVCPSGSCVAMVRNHYAELFHGQKDEAAAREVAGRVFEFSEFLTRMDATGLESSMPGRATYHHSCHLNRELGVKNQPLSLLREVKGLTIIEMEDFDRCCGFGGTFSVKLPEVSAAMARRKAESIAATGVDTVIACDPGCMLHLKGYFSRIGSPVKVMHIAEVLAGRIK
jgi:L-lactate dehydrogenase complex protein LldE